MNCDIYRPLNISDEASISRLLETRKKTNDHSLLGVNWTTESTLKEIQNVSSLGLFNPGLSALVLYKDMTTVLEILLIFSAKGSALAGKKILKALINAHSYADEIWLEVHEGNQRAIDFYERQGFIAMSSRSGYYPDGKRAINYSLLINDRD